MKLEAWEREPLWLKLLTPYLKKKRFPRLEGTPKVGQWVRLYAEGCVTANGEEVYADFQLGSENKLLLFFLGEQFVLQAYPLLHFLLLDPVLCLRCFLFEQQLCSFAARVGSTRQ